MQIPEWLKIAKTPEEHRILLYTIVLGYIAAEIITFLL